MNLCDVSGASEVPILTIKSAGHISHATLTTSSVISSSLVLPKVHLAEEVQICYSVGNSSKIDFGLYMNCSGYLMTNVDTFFRYYSCSSGSLMMGCFHVAVPQMSTFGYNYLLDS